MDIGRFFKRFTKKYHENPAIDALYQMSFPVNEPVNENVEKIILDLPDMAMVFQKVEHSLLKKTLLDQIEEYDSRMGSHISKKIDERKQEAIRRKISSLTLLSFYKELCEYLKATSIAFALTDALYYEMYHSLSSGKGFAEYLDYLKIRNPQFDDQNMTPAHKFGNDISQIVSITDPTFYFIIAQQAAVICASAGKLVRWVLFDEEIEQQE